MEKQKKSIANDEIISTADMATAKEQYAQFLSKGYAPVKWLLKYLCGSGAIRIFDYGKTFPQFYSAFTKRLDTLGIFVSILMQSGLQFCIDIAMDSDEKTKETVIQIKERLRGFNEFMTQNILPLSNDTNNDARKCWLKMEATCMLTRELELKGKKVTSMDAPDFRLTFYEFQTRNTKLPSVDTMAKDLMDLDMRLKRRGLKGGQYYQHQLHKIYNDPTNSQSSSQLHGYGYPIRGDLPLKLFHPNYTEPFPQASQGRPKKDKRGRDRRDYYDRRSGRDRDRDRDRDRKGGRNRDSGRSRSRTRHDRGSRRVPDFEEGYESNWQKKKSEYRYDFKDGFYFGTPKLEKKVCGYFKDPLKKCTFGSKRCRWHHMCIVCLVIGQHSGANCPHRQQMKV